MKHLGKITTTSVAALFALGLAGCGVSSLHDASQVTSTEKEAAPLSQDFTSFVRAKQASAARAASAETGSCWTPPTFPDTEWEVDCNKPHTIEVAHTFTMMPQQAFDWSSTPQEVLQTCTEALGDRSPRDTDTSVNGVLRVLAPQTSEWDDAYNAGKEIHAVCYWQYLQEYTGSAQS